MAALITGRKWVALKAMTLIRLRHALFNGSKSTKCEAVPSEVFSAGIAFLKEFAARDITSLDQARIQAYAIYVLTRNEIVHHQLFNPFTTGLRSAIMTTTGIMILPVLHSGDLSINENFRLKQKK